MIEVTLFQKGGSLTGFLFSGHAGAGEYGYDIVCSAVSVLAINTCNAIESFTDEPFRLDTGEEDGWMELSFTEHPGYDAQLLMKTLVLGLQSIADQYSAFIHFDIEEV